MKILSIGFSCFFLFLSAALKSLHGYSLQVADINGDGNLDIFVAEIMKWSESKTIFKKGFGFH